MVHTLFQRQHTRWAKLASCAGFLVNSQIFIETLQKEARCGYIMRMNLSSLGVVVVVVVPSYFNRAEVNLLTLSTLHQLPIQFIHSLLAVGTARLMEAKIREELDRVRSHLQLSLLRTHRSFVVYCTVLD
jgi:hypothetical protein